MQSDNTAESADGDRRTGSNSSSLSRRQALQAIGSIVVGSTGIRWFGTVRAEPTDCLIFDRPGRYSLEEDVPCIEITAPKVHLDGDGYRTGSVTVQADHVTVRNVELDYRQEWISFPKFVLRSANHCKILGNETQGEGFTIRDSHNNLFRNNTHNDVDFGLSLYRSNNNRIINNLISSIDTISIVHSDRNIVAGNTLHGDASYLANSNKNHIFDNHYQGETGFCGMVVHNCTENNIHDNDIVDMYCLGISISGGSTNRVQRNLLSAAEGYVEGAGVELTETSRNTVVRNRVVDYQYGIAFTDADRNKVVRNQLCAISDPIVFDSESTDNIVNANSTNCPDE